LFHACTLTLLDLIICWGW